MSKLHLRLGKLVPAAIIGLIATSTVVLVVSDLSGQRQLGNALQHYQANVTQNEKILELTRLTKGIEIDIISTQESLTDMSATRGLDGLNDGIDLAEGSANAFSDKIEKAIALGHELNAEGLDIALTDLSKQFEVFFGAGLSMANVYVAGGPEQGNKRMPDFDKIADKMQEKIDATSAIVDRIVKNNADLAVSTSNQIQADAHFMLQIMVGLGALMLLNGVGLCIFISRRMLKPLTKSTDAMNALASGNLETELPGAERHDEIGDLAKAFQNFRENLVQKRAMDIQDAENREKARQQRIANEQIREADFGRTKSVVETLGSALENLSHGDLTHRIEGEFPGDYDALRHYFNMSAERLQTAMTTILGITADIRAGSNDLKAGSDDLARRTNKQAVSLEETASAMEEITSTVLNSRKKAEDAGRKVESASHSANQSDAVVRNAIQAMVNIEESSKQIGDIVSVIESIAFQTNLLALNAGVEAARAGDAGKGFAVVAQEVRELAQKSSSAAKQIATLVERSKSAVTTGVSLVNQTGDTLMEIQRQVTEIHSDISDIVTASREQATGIASINSAIGQMDAVTQENLRMVEETTASASGLADGADVLAERLGQFQVAQTKAEFSKRRYAA